MKNPPSYCNGCGMCNHVCPIFRAYRGREMFSPRFKVKLWQKEMKDKVFFLCVGCENCGSACPNSVEMDFISYRKELYKEGIVPHSIKKIVENVKTHRDPYYDDSE